VGFFPNLENAEYAITNLRSIGFPLNQVSLVAHNFTSDDEINLQGLICAIASLRSVGFLLGQISLVARRCGTARNYKIWSARKFTDALPNFNESSW
jgi:hypothetical protein